MPWRCNVKIAPLLIGHLGFGNTVVSASENKWRHRLTVPAIKWPIFWAVFYKVFLKQTLNCFLPLFFSGSFAVSGMLALWKQDWLKEHGETPTPPGLWAPAVFVMHHRDLRMPLETLSTLPRRHHQGKARVNGANQVKRVLVTANVYSECLFQSHPCTTI